MFIDSHTGKKSFFLLNSVMGNSPCRSVQPLCHVRVDTVLITISQPEMKNKEDIYGCYNYISINKLGL